VRRWCGSSAWSSAASRCWLTVSGPDAPRQRQDRLNEDRVRSRRAGRRLALAAVFEAEFGQRTADAIVERHLALEQDPEASGLAREIVANVMTHRDTLDENITAAAPQYPVSTLARMDRVLLRAGICEVLHSPATPARVAIAEWVELARTYSGEPMRRLMNGVLGRVSREHNTTR
jgi:N utilization substance protein B